MIVTLLVAGLIWMMEDDLAERRRSLIAASVYWTCDEIPRDAVLAKVFAGKVLVERHPGWTRGPKWLFGFAAYTAYYRLRLQHDELADAFLKTPSWRERHCSKRPGRP